MKSMSLGDFGLAALACIALVLPAAAVTIDWVTVGNAGNANDTTGYGGVAYTYKIARNETTIGQYAEFLNAAAKSDPYALYNTSKASSSARRRSPQSCVWAEYRAISPVAAGR